MILEVFRRLNKLGILGINSRNAHYIMAWNPRSAYPKVDDKAITKELAAAHGIPTPETFLMVSHHGEVRKLEKRLRGLDQFVIKPARGAGGSGILLVEKRSSNGFLKVGGELLTLEALRYHIFEIFSGIHSLGGREDRVLVESLVHPHHIFEGISYRGVPDLRIIVYRGVPAMAMVRLPTKASDGKANLHRGAIGAGIVISTGRTTSAVMGRSVLTKHPDTNNPVAGIELPQWEKMLIMAAKASDMTGLKYLGADLVLDRDSGPLLLELNARPGLAIQIANCSGLSARLEAIDSRWEDIGPGPEERVNWAIKYFKGE